jgi:hypothetical protein
MSPIDWSLNREGLAQGEHHEHAVTRDYNLDTSKAERAGILPVRRRKLVLGARTYTAFSAHDLLEHEAHNNPARPGHPY